ncbi:hypothetical protein TNIN_347071 [Trichonephila inaurata madagascariensis]|uniref:Uncharacterized protein n=1 Tax=Trichonephila inaurata madagascariensis TaxID=2747483 RepID=A0A8X6MI13_9ARAC|nr:hypothetical protein TNIN_347071 [Trichonephila inaurata madagascariensis]
MRSHFRKEYLGQLIQRHGHKDCELKVGDIVLVGCENLKRELAHRSCSRAFYWQRRACSSVEGEDLKWHIDSTGEKTVSSGGVLLH